MPFHSKLSRVAVVTATVALVAGCGGPLQPLTEPVTPSTASSAQRGILAQSIAPSLYEVVYSSATHSVFVASIGNFGDGQGGTILQLDDRTLAVQKRIVLPQKVFGLAIDNRSGVLYAGLTLDGAVAAIDVKTGTVKGVLPHGVKDAEGKPVHTRQIAVDENSGKVIVTGITDGGFLWVIDGKSFTTERIIRNSQAPTAGVTLDAASHRLFVSGTAAYAVFDTQTWQLIGENRIAEKLKPSDGSRRFLVNTAFDAKTGRLFANQLNNNEGTLVFDVKTGTLLHTIATGDTPVSIRFNAIRNEVYVASRESGTVSVIDADSYAIKHSIKLPTHPNTLALTPDGQVLFVSVKEPFPEKGQPAPMEQVVRIDLKAL